MEHNIIDENFNVKIRQVLEEDLELLRTWRNDASNTEYLSKISFISEEQQLNWYKEYLKDDSMLMFSIVETESLNRLVGSAALYNRTQEEVEFGKILIGDAQAHGKNVGYNATSLIVNKAFQLWDISRVVLYCYEENKAALRVYKKVGFKLASKNIDDSGKIEYYMKIDRSEWIINE